MSPNSINVTFTIAHKLSNLVKKGLSKAERLELLHKKMIDEIQDYAIILLDFDGTVLTWNKGAETIKGYKAEEIIGQNFSLFYTPEDCQAGLPQQILEQARKEGRARYIGKRVRKDGTLFWGSMLITAIHDEEGDEVIGFIKLTRQWIDNSEEPHN